MIRKDMTLLTIRELSLHLGVSTRTISRLVDMGRFPKPVRIGRSIRWRQIEVEEWLNAGGARVDGRQRSTTKDTKGTKA